MLTLKSTHHTTITPFSGQSRLSKNLIAAWIGWHVTAFKRCSWHQLTSRAQLRNPWRCHGMVHDLPTCMVCFGRESMRERLILESKTALVSGHPWVKSAWWILIVRCLAHFQTKNACNMKRMWTHLKTEFLHLLLINITHCRVAAFWLTPKPREEIISKTPHLFIAPHPPTKLHGWKHVCTHGWNLGAQNWNGECQKEHGTCTANAYFLWFLIEYE